MKKRTKWMVVLAVLGLIGVGGYSAYTYGMNLIGNKIADQLVREAANNEQLLAHMDIPDLPEKIDVGTSNAPVSTSNPQAIDNSKLNGSDKAADADQGQAKAKSVPNATAQTTGSNAQEKQDTNEKKDGLALSNKQEAIKFVMSRFTVSELNRLRQMASGGLTPENKSELKKIAYAKFTSAEIAAVQKVVSSQ